MITVKQKELIDSLMSQINDDEKSFCNPIIDLLLDLGYIPRKHKKSTFVVEFEKNGRIIVKLEVLKQKDNSASLLFWLRFSAADNYSEIFQNSVKRRPEAWIKKNKQYVNHNIDNCCGWCKDKPRLYHFYNEDGSKTVRCGGYTLPVIGVTSGNIPEILKLIKEQDQHFISFLTA